jgi:hypothetical protein
VNRLRAATRIPTPRLVNQLDREATAQENVLIALKQGSLTYVSSSCRPKAPKHTRQMHQVQVQCLLNPALPRGLTYFTKPIQQIIFGPTFSGGQCKRRREDDWRTPIA